MTANDPSSPQMPELMKAFVDQAAPPTGQGNDYFVLNWKVALTLVVYLPYLAIMWRHSAVSWALFAYSLLALAYFAFVIRGFKESMAYQSNPFDFVRVQFLLLLNAVVLFGLSHWTLSSADSGQYSQSIDAFEGVYYSVVTVATLGYGDIYPIGSIARAVVIVEIFFGIWFFITVVPVAVADQAERIRHFRERQKSLGEALRQAWERGDTKPPSSEKDAGDRRGNEP